MWAWLCKVHMYPSSSCSSWLISVKPQWNHVVFLSRQRSACLMQFEAEDGANREQECADVQNGTFSSYVTVDLANAILEPLQCQAFTWMQINIPNGLQPVPLLLHPPNPTTPTPFPFPPNPASLIQIQQIFGMAFATGNQIDRKCMDWHSLDP